MTKKFNKYEYPIHTIVLTALQYKFEIISHRLRTARWISRQTQRFNLILHLYDSLTVSSTFKIASFSIIHDWVCD
jgi:hypothetical protein